jgi:predicted nucleic acid-binding protein
MTRFVVDCDTLLGIAAGDIEVARAWKVADQLGWESTEHAEFVALTQLQGDAFVTSDAKLAAAVSGLVRTASAEALRTV